MDERKIPVLGAPREGAIYKAINRVQGRIARLGVGKDAQNAHDRYKYRSIDAVLDRLSPILADEGVFPQLTVHEWETRERQGRNVSLNHWIVRIEYDFVSAEDGSYVSVETIGEGMDRADKGFNKALAAAFKYAVGQLFCIPYHVDHDPDAETPEVIAESPSSSVPGSPPPDTWWTVDVDAMRAAKDLSTLKTVFGMAWQKAGDDDEAAHHLKAAYDKCKDRFAEERR